MFTIATASGNTFAYVWKDVLPATFDGPAWTRALCARGEGLGLDGLVAMERPRGGAPWVLEHWDSDGARTFCSNATRAALALREDDPSGTVEVLSSGAEVLVRSQGGCTGIRMPQGPDCGLRDLTVPGLERPHAYGWIGNPQLVVEHSGVETIDLERFAVPLRHHAIFPAGTNVSVVEVLDPGQGPEGEGCFRIRTWERGVEGETLCCGTGSAVASAWLASRTGARRWRVLPRGKDPVRVELEPGPDGTWRNLWVHGAVRILGSFSPHASLGLA